MRGYNRVLATLGTLAATGLAGCTADGTLPTEPTAEPDHTADPCAHDVTAPTISSVSASPNALWPPNHKMVSVTVTVAATDDCSDVTSRVVGVTSNEPVDGLGDGHTSPDWIVIRPLTLFLRSERSGLGDGRVYTITVDAVDAAGNAATANTTVTVAHDQGKN